jgi:hypothetical protein
VSRNDWKRGAGSCDASPGTLIHLNSLHLPLILLHRSYLIFFFSSPSVTLLSVLFQIGTISGRHRSLLLCSPCFSLSSSSLLFPFFLARPATPPRRLNQEAPFPTSVSAFLYKRVYLLPLTYIAIVKIKQRSNILCLPSTKSALLSRSSRYAFTYLTLGVCLHIRPAPSTASVLPTLPRAGRRVDKHSRSVSAVAR